MNEPIHSADVCQGALGSLPELLAEVAFERKVYLVADHNTYAAAGRRANELLLACGFDVVCVLLGDGVVPDTGYFFTLLEQIDRNGYLLACGSGTINDLVRYAAFKLDKPYSIIATAPSMDGYASHVSPLTVQGVKKTYNAVTPQIIIADTNILSAAPWGMIQAGYGDLIGKITSLLDWRLSNILCDEVVEERSFAMVKEELTAVLKLTDDLLTCSPESIEVLMRGLIGSGVAMQLAGSSRPASGSEHHISHFLELYGDMYDQPLPPHGVKVAVGLWFSSRLYLRLFEMDFQQLDVRDDREQRARDIRRQYGERARPVLQVLEQRPAALQTACLQSREGAVKALIRENLDVLQAVPDYMRKIGLFSRDDVKAMPVDWIRRAVCAGFEIRNRFTVTALLHQTGVLEETVDELLEEYAELIR